MSDLHSRLQNQLDELGVVMGDNISAEQLDRLLERVSAGYESLSHGRDVLATVLDTLASGTLHFGPEGILKGMNDPALDMFGLPASELIGMRVMEILHLEDGTGTRLTTDDLWVDRRIENGQVRLKNGDAFPASIYISVISGGATDGAVILLKNIESRLIREAELQGARVEALVARRAERAKGLFLANMSHELRTPLNAIIGYSEMLAEGARERRDANDVQDLERIMGAGRHLTHLIGGILDLSKIEAGHMELLVEACDVVELGREALHTLRQLPDAEGLELILDAPDTVPFIEADITRLRQCAFNLLSNAAKFTEEGQITLRITSDGISVRMAVQDTGIGIDRAGVSRIFTEFTQAEETTTKRYGGTGLGLALSRRLCRMMGGDIEVESAVGQGSTFTLVMPVERRPSLTPLPSARETTVLLIDDDLTVRAIVERTLIDEGYSVVSASGGRVGLEFARQLRPSAIVLDIDIPDVDGWQVLAELKTDPELSKIPVILHTLVNERGRGFALGAADYLTKPISGKRLVDTLRRATDQRAGTALLVEDNNEVRTVIQRQLRKQGWYVVSAENGRIGLEVLERERPDVVLLDLMMPEMDGFEFISRLRADPRFEGLPVVVMTAMELAQAEREMLSKSVQRIIQKGSIGGRELLAELRARLR